MKVGIDSYCYHRFFGEVYPDQKPPAKDMTMQDFLERAKAHGAEGVGCAARSRHRGEPGRNVLGVIGLYLQGD